MAKLPHSGGFVTRLPTCDLLPIWLGQLMQQAGYDGYRFPPEIIRHAIWLYLRFTLSLRDVEDLLAERGIIVSYAALGEPFRTQDRLRTAKAPTQTAYRLASG
jgi:transposase-like protein